MSYHLAIDKSSLFFTKASKFPDPYEGTIPKHNEVVRRTIYEEAKPHFESEEQFNNLVLECPDAQVTKQLATTSNSIAEQIPRLLRLTITLEY